MLPEISGADSLTAATASAHTASSADVASSAPHTTTENLAVHNASSPIPESAGNPSGPFPPDPIDWTVSEDRIRTEQVRELLRDRQLYLSRHKSRVWSSLIGSHDASGTARRGGGVGGGANASAHSPSSPPAEDMPPGAANTPGLGAAATPSPPNGTDWDMHRFRAEQVRALLKRGLSPPPHGSKGEVGKVGGAGGGAESGGASSLEVRQSTERARKVLLELLDGE